MAYCWFWYFYVVSDSRNFIKIWSEIESVAVTTGILMIMYLTRGGVLNQIIELKAGWENLSLRRHHPVDNIYPNLLLPIYNSYFSLKRTVDLQSIDLVIGLIVTSDSDTCFSVLECLCLSQLVLYDEIKTWNEAYDICQNSGGRLVSVDSDEKYALLGTYSRSEPWKSASGMWVTLTNSKIPQDLNAANSYTVLLVFFKNHYLYQSKAVVLIVTIFGSIYLLDKAISWFERLLRYM